MEAVPNTELDERGATAGFNSVIYRLQQPFDLSLVLLEMDRPTKPELEAGLVRYRALARQFFDPVSVENMRLATAELEEKSGTATSKAASVGGLSPLLTCRATIQAARSDYRLRTSTVQTGDVPSQRRSRPDSRTFSPASVIRSTTRCSAITSPSDSSTQPRFRDHTAPGKRNKFAFSHWPLRFDSGCKST